MLSALILGLFGSVGHCTGMCSGVALYLGRTSGAHGWRVLLLHLGRVTTYALMGLVAGALGHRLANMGDAQTQGEMHSGVNLPGLSALQGALALIAAGLALYMAIAFVGRAPSPELIFSRITRWWGRTMRRLTVSKPQSQSAPPHSPANTSLHSLASTYTLGLFWGLLPCGLVLMALLLAAVSGSAQRGALTMFVFGLGTWPLAIGVTLAPRLQVLQRHTASWIRPATAAIILIFGVQMALRGLAAWGLVDHLHVGVVTLW